MAQLFKCDTTAKFKIMRWLYKQGVTRDDIAAEELLGSARVKVTNHDGQHMVLVCRGAVVSIDQDVEG